jgi:hypothetical protein
MKKILRLSMYVLMSFVLFASFGVPQGKAHGPQKSQKVQLHIKGEKLEKDTKVTLIYKVKVKEKDKKKDKVVEKELSMSRENGSLYKATKPKDFIATKDVSFKVKKGEVADTYKPSKFSGSKGTVNYWITVDKSADDQEEKDKLTTFTHNEPLIPTVKDVFYNGDGTFTAYWGYENKNDVTVDALVSRFNTSSYVFNSSTPLVKGFAEGKVEEAFHTVFAGHSIVWELTGPDGVKRTATALASNAKTFKSLLPLVRSVYKNVNGTYTAYWGYHNENNVKVDARVSQYLTPAMDNAQPLKASFSTGLVLEAFKSTFNYQTFSWNIVGPNGVSSTVAANTLTAKNYGSLIPTVKAVYDNGNGTFTAYFGYQNNNEVSVDALESKWVSGTLVSGDQPLKNNYQIGTVEEAFSVTFKGSSIMWELTGPDGQKRYVSASSVNAPKYTALQPLVTKVVNNGDGTYTAVWGYHNQNSVVVNASDSKFTGNVLKNELAKKVMFKAGVQYNAFETTFKGNQVTWIVKGPDGVTRSVTAYSNTAVSAR